MDPTARHDRGAPPLGDHHRANELVEGREDAFDTSAAAVTAVAIFCNATAAVSGAAAVVTAVGKYFAAVGLSP